MSDPEAFALINISGKSRIYDDYEEITSGHYADLDTSLQKALRQLYPELSLTITLASNVSLLLFAAGGNATADLDIENEAVKRFRYFYAGDARRGIPDRLVEGRTFAKYNYRWGGEYFIVYVVQIGRESVQYILKEPAEGETISSHNRVADRLIKTVGDWQKPQDYNFVYVFDSYWSASRAMYQEIQKTKWKDVILDEEMKTALTELMHKFFDHEDAYKDLGVPWKRGVIFHGPAGNGKTISIKALMHSLFDKYGYEILSLYVKSAPQTYQIRTVFQRARQLAPCLLIFEDIDTIVTPATRSYFFNEVDGLENNDGLFMIATTNHLDELDPGLSARPSRFDRKYLFPLPTEPQRVLYCEYWRQKLKKKPGISFPKILSPAIAGITQDFSYAYLKEAFVSTLLVIAGNHSDSSVLGGGDDDDDDDDDTGGNDLDKYELWREMKKQVKQLRKDMDNRSTVPPTSAQDLTTVVAASPNEEGKSFTTEAVHSPSSSQLATPIPSEPNHRPSLSTSMSSGQPVHSSQIHGRGMGAANSTAAVDGGTAVDCDFRHAPLMTDGGMFIDSMEQELNFVEK